MTGLITWHVILSIFCIILGAYLGDRQVVISTSLGALISVVNIAVLAWSWWRILSKKTVALAAGVIVFKYAILGLIIYVIVRDQKVDLIWFLIGLSTFIPAMLIYAFQTQRFKK